MTGPRQDGTSVGIAHTAIRALESVQPNRDGIRAVQVDPQLIVADLCNTSPDRPVCA